MGDGPSSTPMTPWQSPLAICVFRSIGLEANVAGLHLAIDLWARIQSRAKHRPKSNRLERALIMHRSRLCHLVIDVSDLDDGVSFWSAALGATEEPLSEQSSHVYRRLRLPDSNIRILIQRTSDKKVSKERMHLDIETDDLEAEVRRLEALGATRWSLQQERGFRFWVLQDPWKNEFCILQTEFPALLAQRKPWPE